MELSSRELSHQSPSSMENLTFSREMARNSAGPAMMASPPFLNVACYLDDMARRQPATMAIACPAGRDSLGRTAYAVLNYQQFAAECDRLANGLTQLGLRRGMRTVLMVKPSIEFFALTFALFKIGAVLVMVDPGMGVSNLTACLNEAEPEAFIGVAKAHLARCLFGWGRRHVRLCVTVGRRWGWSGVTLAQVFRQASSTPFAPVEVEREETAAILFTSGSTGVPKGAVYTHGIFATQVEAIRSLYGLQPGEIDLCTFPLFALFAPAFGWSAVIPDMDASRPGEADPVRILNAIQTFGVTNMFGSPALLERVGNWGAAQGVQLPTLQRVISAGAPVRPEVIIAFHKLLPSTAVIHTPYGATEALPVASITSSEIVEETRHATAAGAGVCVGRPVANLDVRIIRITDEPIPRWHQELEMPRGEIGEIVVRGPQVTQSYFRRPDATAHSKIAATEGGPSWHRMGDVGYFDQQGRLWYCGRKTHRVVTENGTLFTECCEAIFNRHSRVRRTALVGVGQQPQRPVLCVELRSDYANADRSKILAELRALGAASELTKEIDTFLFHPGFPVDVRHNAKIFRERLAAWAAQRLR